MSTARPVPQTRPARPGGHRRAPVPQRNRALPIVAVAVAAVLAVAAGIVFAVTRSSPPPAEGSADIGYVRDMRAHLEHGNQILAAAQPKLRAKDARAFAGTASESNAERIEDLDGLLREWKAPPEGGGPALGWLKDPSDPGEIRLKASKLTPRQLLDERVKLLNKAEGGRYETMLLEVLLQHRQVGVAMSQAALRQGENDDVRSLAEDIVAEQKAEIGKLNPVLINRHPDPDMNKGYSRDS